jgi:Tol biopolymer transport system component
MGMRRTLLILIGLLLAFIVLAGAGVAALAFWRFGLAPRSAAQSLLVVGGDRSLTLLGGDGAGRTLAEDVSAELFHYPSTSRDGSRVVYISRDPSGTALAALDLASGERVELYRSTGSPPLYAAWSPDGRHVSFLATRTGGGLEIYIVPADGSAEAARIGTAAGASYFAWRPDGAQLLLHTSGRPSDSRVATFEPGNPEPLSQRDDPGFFQAPAWSEDRVGPDGEPTVVASEKQAAILFSRAPGSDHLAYVTVSPSGFGALKVVDGAGGEVRTLSRPDESIPGFFWSPDGSQIAYLTFSRGESGAPEFTWHLVGRDGGEVRDLVSFTPSQAFAGLVGYFDAYAISLELWSPDGRSIVYGSDDGVYALDVASGAPTRQADGVLGLWVRR